MKIFFATALMMGFLSAQQLNVMPMPANIVRGEGALILTRDLDIVFTNYSEPRLIAAASRLFAQLSKSTGIPMSGPSLRTGGTTALTVRCDHASKPVQAFGEDESYTLIVDSKQATLDAPNPLGVLRGFETFVQLVEPTPNGFAVPAVKIEDKPRFPWRGLMIDVSRHWMPMPVILRQLDAMAAVKLNVFHWHLTDDQGFRIESKLYPKLQELGSDGHFYTQDQVREVVAYAHERGIRVVPEFDMPGHTTAWFVGMPELASANGPYQIERTWGVFAPTMDVTREWTYQFLDKFIGEMTALFPDEYFHIGGDEVSRKSEWNSSAHIQEFEKQHGMKNNDDLQAYFNKRVQAIVTKHGKRMEGWDEIMNPELPKDIVIQSWRGVKSLSDGARLGFQGLLSAPYYLDHMEPASTLYAADPLGGPEAASLTDEQRARILGGEVCMWDEYVTPEIIDGRIWPRTAAIAERFWSPASVTDVPDMYRRLDMMSRRLEWLGLQHETNYRTMLERLAGSDAVEPLKNVADIVRPVPLGGRQRAGHYTQQTPLNRLVDTSLPESRLAREFAAAVESGNQQLIRMYLLHWKANDSQLQPMLAKNILLAEVAPVSSEIAKLAAIGLQALDHIAGRKPAAAAWIEQQRAYTTSLIKNRKPPAEVVILIVEPIQKLVDRAGQ